MKKPTLGCGLLLVCLCEACATTFTGNAHVEGQRHGCERKCKSQDMELSGMVYIGEYSDACICSVPTPTSTPAPGATPSQSSSDRQRLLSEGALAAVSAGVVMTQKRDQEKARGAHLP